MYDLEHISEDTAKIQDRLWKASYADCTCKMRVYEVMQTWKELGLDHPWRFILRSFAVP